MTQAPNRSIPRSAAEEDPTLEEMATRLDQIADALFTTNYGATEPPQPTFGMLWLDTSAQPYALKMLVGPENWVTLGHGNATLGRFEPASHTNIGDWRPDGVTAGTMWIRNNVSPWVLYLYDGTDDIAIMTLDPVTNTASVAGGALPSKLQAIQNLTLANDQMFYATGPSTFAATPLTGTGRAILSQPSVAAVLNMLGGASTLSNSFVGQQIVYNGQIYLWNTEGSYNGLVLRRGNIAAEPCGYVDFQAPNSVGAWTQYSTIINVIENAGSGAETAKLRLNSRSGGQVRTEMQLGQGVAAWGVAPLGSGTINAQGLYVNGQPVLTSVPAGVGLGAGQTWQDMTTVRSAGTWYQNTSGRPICVYIRCRHVNAGGSAQVLVSPAASGGIEVGYISGEIAGYSFVVPANWFYGINNSLVADTNWAELR